MATRVDLDDQQSVHDLVDALTTCAEIYAWTDPVTAVRYLGLADALGEALQKRGNNHLTTGPTGHSV